MTRQNKRSTDFQTLIAQHEGILYRVVNTYTSNREDQLDLLQEIRLQLWRAFPKFDPTRAFPTWAYRIAFNTAISWFRRHSAEPIFSQLEDHEETPKPMPPQKAEILALLIEQLNPFDRAILTLYLDDIPHSEIAQIVGTTPGNVATKLSRIKSKLKSQFKSKDTH